VRVADGKGGNWLKNLPSIPDDHEDANGESVLTFWQAQDAARKFLIFELVVMANDVLSTSHA